jgi:hypothetical protein
MTKRMRWDHAQQRNRQQRDIVRPKQIPGFDFVWRPEVYAGRSRSLPRRIAPRRSRFVRSQAAVWPASLQAWRNVMSRHRKQCDDDLAVIAEIEAGLLANMGDNITDAQRRAARRCAELQALAARARQSALNGASIDLDAILKLEDAAAAAAAALPTSVEPVVSKLEVELVGNPERMRALKDENATLKARLEALEGHHQPQAGHQPGRLTRSRPQ